MKSMGVAVYNTKNVEFGPKRPGDVGHDLYAVVDHRNIFDLILSLILGKKVVILWPIVGQRTLGSGLALIMPVDIWCEIRPRSSTSKKKLIVQSGTIDSGYMGELFTVIHNYGLVPRIIADGERYAQVIFYPAVRPMTYEIALPTYEAHVNQAAGDGGRAGSGFGSTGR